MTAIQPVCPVRLKKGHEEDILQGTPWISTSDIIASSEHMLVPAGSLVAIENHKGQSIGIGTFNVNSPIACRVLTLDRQPVDASFFENRLRKALLTREKLVDVPYYRLVHSEADGLPGLLLDRLGDVMVAQVGTAGMELLQPLWLEALEKVISPQAIVLRNDTSARLLERLKQEVRVIKGTVPALVEVHENGIVYLADLLKGQKTGWFYDQRDNRKIIAGYAKGKTLLDVYSHSGGFGLLAAKHGAQVTMVDSSQLALDLAKQAANINNLECSYQQGDAFMLMQKLHQEGKKYDIVLADPPAFIKSRKDITSGMKGYEKVARLAAALVAPGGMLFVASCSHHAVRNRFNDAVIAGAVKAGVRATIIKQTGAAADHPRHPRLPQSEYLKGILLGCQPAG